MKTKIKRGLYFLPLVFVLFASCKKEYSSDNTVAADETVIAVAAGVSSVSDSVYVVNACSKGSKRDTVSQASLPAAISFYLDANYAGYTFGKAYAVKDSAGTLNSYVVIVYYNDKPVALKFDASGSFVKVLEQREKSDLHGGRGWHHGGRFEGRSGSQKDTIALSALPSAILSYMSSDYPSDTLSKAYINKDSSYVVISRNNGLYATVFDAAGNFVKRMQLHSHQGKVQEIEQTALLSVITSYLSTTYPNYVFKKAFSISKSGTLEGYVVLIDANNTKYALLFDAAGSFVKVKTVH